MNGSRPILSPLLRPSSVAACCLLLPLIATGCATPAAVRQPMRAIWVTRGDYRSADDVKTIVANCADAGFNTILFQVRGNGTAFYRSSYEPWAVELGGRDPGWDPLALAISEAHARDIDLHAWVNVMPAWRGTKPPDDPNQLYNARPEWFWYDQHGNRQKLSSFYVSLNPCLPEVREYLVKVFAEIAADYDIDGLHLDYIRFPNEPPATPAGSGLDYPRDKRTLLLYHEATRKTPDEDREAWNTWRTEQVSQLVADIHAMLRKVRPSAVLTAAAGSVRKNALTHFQDAQAWMERGIVDAVILMNYTDSPDEFAKRNEPWLEVAGDVPVIPGLWFGRHQGKSPEEAAAAVKQQIRHAVEQTGDFCIFSYASLFDTREDARAGEMRRVRRESLLPYLKELAE